MGKDTLALRIDKGESIPVLQLGREWPGAELGLHCPGEWAALGVQELLSWRKCQGPSYYHSHEVEEQGM